MASDPVLTRPQLIAWVEAEAVWEEHHSDPCHARANVFRAIAQALQEDRPDGEEYEQPQRTLDIIARMLGWMNTPPRRVFEQEINALKARAVPEDAAPTPPPADEVWWIVLNGQGQVIGGCRTKEQAEENSKYIVGVKPWATPGSAPR